MLGGQKEKLYDDTDLQDMSYALKKAWDFGETNNIELNFSGDFKKLLREKDESNK